jgi:hypothetical protein
MNERIKELERECWEPRKHPVSQASMGDKFNTEKFAQLVVKECIQVGGPDDSYTDEWFKAKADSVSKIKQHFGVEK